MWKVVLGLVATLVSLLCWASASPPFSAPDEQLHLASIWCAQGGCATTEDPAVRVVPPELVLPQCFSGDPAKSASCRPGGFGDHMEPTFPSTLGNWNGAYPPVYYWLMSGLVLDNLDSWVLLTRAVNAVIAVVLIGLLLLLLPRRLRPVLVLAFLATSVPLLLFVGGSVNPSAWANLSAGTLWLALYAAFETTGRRRLALLGLVPVATVVGAGARADAALFAIVGVALALGLRLDRLRRDWPVTLTGAGSAALAGLIFLMAGHSDVLSGGIPGYVPAPVSGLHLLVANALQVPFLWFGALGIGPLANLGWFDTPMPFVVGAASTAVCAAVAFTGWRRMWWNKVVALSVTGLALMVYPLVVLQESHVFAGQGVQPRYLLPLMIVFVGISLLTRRGPIVAFGRVQLVGLGLALVVAQSVALFTNIQRYTQGIPPTQIEPLRGQGWWWDTFPLSPTGVWVLGSVAFACVVWVVLAHVPRLPTRSPNPTPSDDPRVVPTRLP